MKHKRKFRPVKVKTRTENQVKTAKEKKSLADLKDTYDDLIGNKIVNVDETTDFHISIKRGGEYGLPELQVREFKQTKTFQGITKRGIDIPLNVLEEVSDLLVKLFDEVEEKGYINEYK